LVSNATYSVGNMPTSVIAADVNGDGKVDLISANENTGNLTVLTNNGNGGFGFNATYPTVAEPTSVTAADINGDGAVDLIVASANGSHLTVLTNNGSGKFLLAPPQDVPGYFVTTADVNGDGKADLITANYDEATLSVVMNTSIFPAPTSTPALSINPAFSGNSVCVSWPSASAGWSLQQNQDLTTSGWSPSGFNGYSVLDDGINKSLIISTSAGNCCFRLLHP